MTEPAPTTLLLVDDEPTLREPLAEYLTRQAVSYTHLTLPTIYSV